MGPRLRRLAADYARLQETFGSHRSIAIAEAEGDPPDRYVFEMAIPGLSLASAGSEPARTDFHRVEILLALEYPRRPPFCRMLTPVFHPNIDPAKICIGDHWNAGQSLAHLVVRIAEMITYQSYNTRSPLNGEAAAWAERHLDRLPLLMDDLSAGL